MNRLFQFCVIAFALALAVPVPASAQNRCSRETLTVRSTPVTASYCVDTVTNENGDVVAAVNESFSSPRGNLGQSATLRFVRGVESSRVIEDLDLAKLGIEGTLHLTLVLRGSVVRIESAMLTPGAITVK